MISYNFSIEPNRLAIKNMLDTLENLHIQHKQEYNLSDTIFFRLCLIVDELLTNIVSYGLGNQPTPCITVDLTIEQKKICATIKDNGISFNPLTFIPPKAEKNIENAQIGKIGIQFVKTFSRNIEYHRENEFNCLTLECSDTAM